MFIEADPDRQITLAANYATRPDIQCVLGKVTSSGPACLDALVAAHGALLEIGVLSIDIDGNDYHVWRGSVKLSPAIVIIEFNPTIPADVVYAQPDDPDEAFGSSLAALTDLAADKGYRLVAATEWNAFFMQENLCAAGNLQVYTPESVKTPDHELRLYYGTNGRCKTSGLRQLIWHNVIFSEDQLQVLPADLIAHPDNQPDSYYQRLVAVRASLNSDEADV